MADTIIKPKANEDFYVVYSSIIDSPKYYGSRENLMGIYPDATDDRFQRADKYGSSALWCSPHGWEDTHIMVREDIVDETQGDSFVGYVERERLREFCESRQKDQRFYPKPGLVQWVTDI